MNLQDWLRGKKTYLVALSSLIALAIAWGDGKVTEHDAITQAVGLVLAMTVRHGVDNAASKAVERNAAQESDGIKIRLVDRK